MRFQRGNKKEIPMQKNKFNLQDLLKNEPNLEKEREYILTHSARYEHTYDHFLDVFIRLDGKKVLVLGGSSSFERYVSKLFNFELQVVSSDIRKNWQIASESVDAIFCFEVIEHLG
jgi:hypothetical protein